MNYSVSEIEELNQVCSDLRDGKTATPVTIRNFLWWFDTQRRTPARVQYIDEELARLGIRTVPNYHDVWVDTPITFELIADHKDEAASKESTTNADGSMSKEEDIPERTAADPSFRIGKIPSANIAPVYVSPNANLAEAITLMLARNFSQLPVMTTERDVKGVISWASIGARGLGAKQGSLVQHFMDEHYEIPLSA
jgi:CBS domain-containing protein